VEQLVDIIQTQSNWLLIIGGIVVIFFVISLVRTLIKAALVCIFIMIIAFFILDMTPEQLADTGTESLKGGTEFLQEKMLPLISDFYIGELIKREEEHKMSETNRMDEYQKNGG
jgi:uncharacterized membrane protein YfhO